MGASTVAQIPVPGELRGREAVAPLGQTKTWVLEYSPVAERRRGPGLGWGGEELRLPDPPKQGSRLVGWPESLWEEATSMCPPLLGREMPGVRGFAVI